MITATIKRVVIALSCLAIATLAITMLSSGLAHAQGIGPSRWSKGAGPIPWPVEVGSTLRCSLYLPAERSPSRFVDLDADIHVFVHYTDGTGAKVKERPVTNGVRLPTETDVSLALVQQTDGCEVLLNDQVIGLLSYDLPPGATITRLSVVPFFTNSSISKASAPLVSISVAGPDLHDHFRIFIQDPT